MSSQDRTLSKGFPQSRQRFGQRFGLGADPLLLALLVLGPIGFGLLSLGLGLDANWDLKNYHYYNAYALLEGRYGFDVAPAHQPTFYNPLLYVPLYGAFEHVPARAIGFTLGALHGLNLPLLYGLAREVLRRDLKYAPLAALGLALFGMSGAGALSEVGTSFADIFLSLFFLGALLLLLRAGNQGENALTVGVATAIGASIGVAIGFKLTMAVYGVGLGVGILGIGDSWRIRLKLFAWFGIGAALGFALTGGYWAYFLWERYQNPFFPYFNPLFRSPYVAPIEQAGTGFAPKTVWEALVYPLLFTLESKRVSELEFRDARILIAYGLIVAALAWSVWRRPKLAVSEPRANRVLLMTAAGVYLPWLFVFAVYRYLVGLEMLAPLVAVAALDRLGLAPRKQALVALGLALVALGVQDNANWGRKPWPAAGDYFGVRAPDVPEPEQGIVLMAGLHPIAYAIPKFPGPLRFVRLQGYFVEPTDAANPQNALINGIIAAHEGAFYALFTQDETRTMDDALKVYGREIRRDTCQAVPNVFEDRLNFCAVTVTAPRADRAPSAG
jgi:hypothetical protein